MQSKHRLKELQSWGKQNKYAHNFVQNPPAEQTSSFKIPYIFTLSGVFSFAMFFLKNDSIPKISKQIGFIGDGNMAKAICKGIVSKGLISYSQVSVSCPYIKNLDIWQKCGANITTDNSSVAANTDIVFLTVKPHLLPQVIDSLHRSKNFENIKNKVFVSTLAGYTIEMLENLLSKFSGSKVIRVMPNTPVMVGEGCTVYCPGKNVPNEDISVVKRILSVSGICEMVPEHMINAITALSGGGPSFVFLIIEALSDGGVKMGLHREMATKFAIQTVLGAAKMALHTGKHTGILKDEVCSAGGSTIAGMHVLEKAGVSNNTVLNYRKLNRYL